MYHYEVQGQKHTGSCKGNVSGPTIAIRYCRNHPECSCTESQAAGDILIVRIFLGMFSIPLLTWVLLILLSVVRPRLRCLATRTFQRPHFSFLMRLQVSLRRSQIMQRPR